MAAVQKRKKLRILVADDDRRSLASLLDLVQMEGHVPFPAGSGMEALATAREHRIDLSILDYHMPGLDGPETLVRMRRIYAVLPCIFVTGDSSEAAVARAREAGGFAVLEKPLEIVSFRKVIGDVLTAFADLWRMDRPLRGGPTPLGGLALL